MPLPRFEKLPDERKDSILVAAAQEFAEHGFAGASFNQIIQRAGISKGAMYYYFADKDDLYCTVLDVALSRWLAELSLPAVPPRNQEETGLGSIDSASAFWAACTSVYAQSLRFMLRDPLNAALCLSISRARARMEGHPKLLEQKELMRAWTSALVLQGQSVGAVRDDLPLDLLVHSCLAIMDAGDRWLAEHWSELGEGDVDRTAAMMIGMFRRLGEVSQ